MEREKRFLDRSEAGVELGKLLAPAYKGLDMLVLGIARGGVVVAYEVAKILHGELSVLISKKIPHPLQEELAIGACAEDGSVFLTALARSLDSETIQDIVKEQMREIKSRVDRFRRGKSLPPIKNRIVIIVDDGIATGATLVPAIRLCRSKMAAKVVVASPVSGQHYVSNIDTLADEVIIAERPKDFYAVGQVYEDFHHLSDEEVTHLLDDFEREFALHVRPKNDDRNKRNW